MMEDFLANTLEVDIETYSSVDIKLGAYAYAEAPDFDILLIAYKFFDKNVKVIDMTVEGEAEEHFEFWEALMDPRYIKIAHNANFERTCLAKYCKTPMPPEQWRCTAVMAAQLGLPRSLKDVGKALNMPEDAQKLKTGTALIQYFCKPCKPTKSNGNRTRNLPHHSPDRWALFKEYNAQDVVAEHEIFIRLKDFAPNQAEEELWDIDQTINDRGVRLDIPMAQSIVEHDINRTEELLAEAQKITRLDNPNSLAQLKPWLEEQGLDPISSLSKDVVASLLDSYIPDNVRRVLEIRQQLGKTSIKKYQTMLDIACHDDRARGIMQFYGGHTGRWAGRGLQPQNLAKNTMPDDELDMAHELVSNRDFKAIELYFDSPADVFSQLIRTAFIPSPGNRFVVSDFSAIEARVIAWIAGEQWRLDVFENNGDIYCESASHIYHVPVVKHGINGELRQRGKVAELALGYGGSVGAMKNMDTTGSVPEEEMQGIVRNWRAESPNIVKMWNTCQDAAVRVISGDAKKLTAKSLQGTSFYMDTVAGTPVMFVGLPSGRPIAFWDPKVIDSEYGPRITYMNQNQTTRKWERTETYGGKLTENIVQSIARDCLAEKMRILEANGYHIVFHVHDELIIDAPREDTRAAEYIDRVMGEPIDWAPGLPLKGGTYECDFYRKD